METYIYIYIHFILEKPHRNPASTVNMFVSFLSWFLIYALEIRSPVPSKAANTVPHYTNTIPAPFLSFSERIVKL